MIERQNFNRFALGTVQFGMHYGVANSNGKASKIQISKTLDLALDHGMDTLDTANSYGTSEETLGSIGINSWQVVTKIPPLPNTIKSHHEVEQWINATFAASCLHLNQTSVYGLLLHNSLDLLGEYGQTVISTLHELKSQNKIKALGVSIYDPNELNSVPSHFDLNIIQAPFNVFDQRLLTSGWMQKLHAQGCQIHTRSAYLQGLLLMEKGTWPDYFKPWSAPLNNWVSWCETHSISPIQAALNFVLSHPLIDRVIIGVDKPEQLNDIFILNQSESSICHDLQQHDINLIDPSKWQLN